MDVTLEDAWTKLRWSKKHFESLRPEIEDFEHNDNHTISFEIHPEEGKYTFYVHGLDAPDEDWGLQLGDCIHNARAALDYLVVRLVALVTGKDPRDITRAGFPIESNPAKFARFTSEAGTYPTFGNYLARIQELQPFNIGDPSIWGHDTNGLARDALIPAALDRLSNLDNVDKHRVIHAVWAGIQFNLFDAFPNKPSSFRHVTSTLNPGALENDAEIGAMWFATPLPGEWHPKQMDMKRHFRIQVALDEALPYKGVLEAVPFCLWGVEAVLKIFEPVFTQGTAPLPVTAVPDPDLAHTPRVR